MKRYIFFSLLLFSCSALARNVIDDAGNVFSCQLPAQRIISLSPAITETLFEIGIGAKIVGVIQGDYPVAAQQLPVVGFYSGLDLEKIIALKPDLIISWGNYFAQQIQALKRFNIPIYISNPQRLTDISATMEKLSCLVGTEQLAILPVKRFTQQLKTIQQRYKHAKSVRVFYQIGTYALLTVNQKSWISDIITLCGGHNIFATVPLLTPVVSWEAVVTADPEVVISDAPDRVWEERWQRFNRISAVKKKRLFAIPADLIDRPGPRLLQGVMRVCECLQKAR